MDKLSILAMALDAMEPGSKGYIDYKNKPGYQWRTINEAKVLLNGKGKIVSGAGGKFKGKTWGKKWKFKKKPKEGQQAGQNPLNAAAEALEEPTQNIENVPETAVNVPESVQTEKPEESVAGKNNEATEKHYDASEQLINECPDDNGYLAGWAFQQAFYNTDNLWDDDGKAHKDMDAIMAKAKEYIKNTSAGENEYDEAEANKYLDAIATGNVDDLIYPEIPADPGEEQSPLEQAVEVAPEYKEFDEKAFLDNIAKNEQGPKQYLAKTMKDMLDTGATIPEAIEMLDEELESETYKGALMDIEAEYHAAAGSEVAAENASEFTPEPDYDKAKKATFDLFMNAEYGSMTEQIANDINSWMKVDKKQYSEALESTLSKYDVTDPKVQEALKEINKAVTGEEQPYFENMALAQSPNTEEQDNPNAGFNEEDALEEIANMYYQSSGLEEDILLNFKTLMSNGASFEDALQSVKDVYEGNEDAQHMIDGLCDLVGYKQQPSYLEQAAEMTPEVAEETEQEDISQKLLDMYIASNDEDEMDVLSLVKNYIDEEGMTLEESIEYQEEHLSNPDYLNALAKIKQKLLPEAGEKEPMSEEDAKKVLQSYAEESSTGSLANEKTLAETLLEHAKASGSLAQSIPYVDDMVKQEPEFAEAWEKLKKQIPLKADEGSPAVEMNEPDPQEAAHNVFGLYSSAASGSLLESFTGSMYNKLSKGMPYSEALEKAKAELSEYAGDETYNDVIDIMNETVGYTPKEQPKEAKPASTNNQPSKESIEKALTDMYMKTDSGEESTILSDALAHYQNYGDLDAAFKYASEENSWIENVETKADQTKKSFMNTFYPSAEPKAENSLANQPKVDAGEAQGAALSVYLHSDSDSLEEKIADKLGDNLAANMSYEDALKMLTDEYADSPEFMKAIYHVNEKVMEKVGPAGYDPPQYVEPPKAETPKPKKPKVTKKMKLEAGKSQAEQMANQTNSINAKIAGQKYLEAMDENPKATANQLLKIAEQKITEMPAPGTGGTSWKANLDKAKAYLKDIQDSVKNAGKNALEQAGAMMTSFPKQAYSAGAKAAAVKCHSMDESKQKFMGVFHKAWANCSAAERHAAWDYTGSYSKFNEPLRGIEYGKGGTSAGYKGVGNINFDEIGTHGYGGYKPGQIKKEIQDLTNAIDKSEYKENIHLRRGVDYDGMDKFFNLPKPINHYSVDELQKILTGNAYTEHGFMSCGAAEKTGFTHKDMELKVYAPAGSKMLYCPDFSQYDTENEMLLQRGTKFKVTNVSKVNGKLTIEMDIIGYDMQKV